MLRAPGRSACTTSTLLLEASASSSPDGVTKPSCRKRARSSDPGTRGVKWWPNSQMRFLPMTRYTQSRHEGGTTLPAVAPWRQGMPSRDPTNSGTCESPNGEPPSAGSKRTDDRSPASSEKPRAASSLYAAADCAAAKEMTGGVCVSWLTMKSTLALQRAHSASNTTTCDRSSCARCSASGLAVCAPGHHAARAGEPVLLE